MPKKGLFVFPDPLLTEKLLAFASYLDENNRQTEIALKLSRDVYKYTYFLGRRAPVYYTSDHSPAALNKFINSKLFDLLKKELDTCIQYLNDWVIEGNVMVSNDGETIPAVSILNYFLERLKSDFYSDHRTFFYSEGKKNIEVIAVLIRDENISLEFRKKIIITLLSDEGLTLCAGGGLARLSEAAENLKNYGLFTANGLIKRFIVVIAKEAALRGMQFRKNNPSQLICLLTKVSIEDYEIHALNYLLARLRSDLNLQFLVIPSDPNIETIKHYLQEQQR